MPIMAAQGRNDARSAARLLASTARDCICDPSIAPNHQVQLENVYRLLEIYRTNAFFGLERPRRQPSGAQETLSRMRPDERHVKDVRDVLERAVASNFAGQSKEQAIEVIENVLRSVAYPQQFQHPSEEDRNKATHFFEEMLQDLRFA